jgi:diadenosine tetraphosphatase ApaH/serine/threonine PP2A family protein phosphatase
VPYLILSDIHSNLEALNAVLEDARGRYDRILCLGDLVGYGADANAVAGWARQNATVVVRGNHDRACCGLEDLENYNPAARASAIWTRRAITPEIRQYLEQLPQGPVQIEDGPEPFDLVHGSPYHEDEYLVNLGDVQHLKPVLQPTVTFFGHTHVQGGFAFLRQGVRRISPQGPFHAGPPHRFLINPGSVGQPRDRDPRAAYALYSPEDRLVEFRRVEYDIRTAARKIRTAGLPEVLAARLFEGV